MRQRVVLCAVLIVASIADKAEACQFTFERVGRQGVLRDVRPGFPNSEAIRVVGVVTGYGSVTYAVGKLKDVDIAATLRLRIQEVVSGKIAGKDVEVVSLFHSADCSSRGIIRESLEAEYPVGTPVVVFGELIAGFGASAGPAIIAELNQGGFVWVNLRNVRRTETDDLDFRHLPRQAGASNGFLVFELDRALLGLFNSPQHERFSRLQNLAYYSYSFLASPESDRQFFLRLVSESGVTAEQTRRLLQRFDDNKERARAH
jgi:hypothetical protein